MDKLLPWYLQKWEIYLDSGDSSHSKAAEEFYYTQLNTFVIKIGLSVTTKLSDCHKKNIWLTNVLREGTLPTYPSDLYVTSDPQSGPDSEMGQQATQCGKQLDMRKKTLATRMTFTSCE